MIARSVTHNSDGLEPTKGVGQGQIGVFQSEYITKLITHFPVQFNYVKIMKYHYL